MADPAQRYVSLEDFLISEAADASGVRREWVDGHVYAMAGASPEHGRLVANVVAELRGALRGTCSVRDGSVAVHIAATRAGLRPDVTVICGPMTKTVVEKNGRIEGEAITNPCVIVEVLSETTERDDRGWKFRDYRTLASLEDYVLVSQHTRRIEIFRRADGWAAEAISSGRVRIRDTEISIDAIYDE